MAMAAAASRAERKAQRPILLRFNSKGGSGVEKGLNIFPELVMEILEGIDIVNPKMSGDPAQAGALFEKLAAATKDVRWNKKVVVYGHSIYAGGYISDFHRERTGKQVGEFIEGAIYAGTAFEANVVVLSCYIGNETNETNTFLREMSKVFGAKGRPYHLKGSRRMVSINVEDIYDEDGAKTRAVTGVTFLGTLHSAHRKEWPAEKEPPRAPFNNYVKYPAGHFTESHQSAAAYAMRKRDKLAVFNIVSSRPKSEW